MDLYRGVFFGVGLSKLIESINPHSDVVLEEWGRCVGGTRAHESHPTWLCWRNEASKKPPYMVVLEEWRAQGSLLLALIFSGIDVDLAARRLQQLPHLSKTGLPPLSQPTIPTVLKPGSLPPLPSILNMPTAILSQELVVDGGGKRKGIEGMVVEIVGIKGKLGRVTSGVLDKLGMLGSRGSESGFNTVGIVG
ncbi:hypothetical protein GQ457_15G021990 [Hibiscus cannabinus]